MVEELTGSEIVRQYKYGRRDFTNIKAPNASFHKVYLGNVDFSGAEMPGIYAVNLMMPFSRCERTDFSGGQFVSSAAKNSNWRNLVAKRMKRFNIALGSTQLSGADISCDPPKLLLETDFKLQYRNLPESLIKRMYRYDFGICGLSIKDVREAIEEGECPIPETRQNIDNTPFYDWATSIWYRGEGRMFSVKPAKDFSEEAMNKIIEDVMAHITK